MTNNYNSLCSGMSTSHKNSWHKKATMLLFFVMFSVLGVQGQVTVAGCTGAGNGSYASLSLAFSTIVAAQPAATITVTITANTTEPVGGATLVAGTWTSLTIAPSGGPWTVSGPTTAGTPMITFNGSDNVTINGGGNLIFSNTTASATTGTSTLKLFADATNNTFNNVTFLGSGFASTGSNTANVWISTGTTTGNDNNSFQSCKFGPAGVNFPSQLVVANGSTTTSAIANSNVTFNNCEFYDFFLAGGCAAINAGTGNTDWNITNNKVYQTASRAMTSTMSGFIFSNSTFGNNLQITGNTIGYANNALTGTLTLTGTGSFTGINFTLLSSAATTSNVNSNIISDISLTSGSGTFTGITNSTTASSNTININSNTVRNIANLGSTGTMIAIQAGAATTLTCSSNTINNISRNTGGTFYGINYASPTAVTFNNNTISNLSSTSTTSSSSFYLIYSGASPVTETWTNNTISNISSSSTGFQTICGIYNNTGSGTKTITGNTITGLSLASAGSGTIYGIRKAFGGTTDVVSGNNVNSFSGGTNIYGINIASGTTNNVFNNKIYGLSSSATTPAIYGIYVTGGTTHNVYNNIIGNLTTPAANTAIAIAGIYFSSGTTDNAYYNTIYLSGTSSGALFGSTAIYASTTPTVDLRNNIFDNTCTSVGATGFATAYRRTGTTLTSYASSSNNNLFYGSTLYYDGTTAYATLAAYQTLVAARDSASKFQNPTFTSTTGSASTFLHFTAGVINQSGGFGTPIAAYTTDYDGQTRDATNPDIGADEFVQGVVVAPTFTSFTPSSLCVTGGQTVNIVGTNLDSVTSVLFNGSTGLNLAGTITAQTATTITVTAPAAVVDGNIRVTNSAGFADSGSTFTASPTPTIGVTPGSTICSGTGTSLTATGGATYSWSPATGLSATTGATVTASPTTTTTYTVTGTNAAGCSSIATVTITVSPVASAVTVTKNPTSVCVGGITTLTASGGTTSSLPSAYAFSGSTGTYNAITGTTLGATAIGDDVGIGNLPIGFTFNYNGVDQTVFAASSNGLLLLGNTTVALTGFSSNALASTANVISPLWDDNNTTGGSIIYSTTGTAPNRVLTVQWTGMHVAGSGSSTNPTINMQALLYESGNVQFIYGAQSAALSSPTATIGISGASGNFISVSPLSPITSSTTSTSTENTAVVTANIPSGTILTFTKPASPVLSWLPITDLFTDAAATVPYAGGTNTIVYSKSNSAQTYTATATLGVCPVSGSATVTPNALPTIAANSASICTSGGGATLTATGGSTYAWAPSGGLSATTGTSVTATPSTTTIYTITGTNANGCINTGTSTVTVNAAVAITTQPSNAAVTAPNTATFTLNATGTGLAYQWYENSVAISGATSNSYTTVPVTAGMNGNTYYCIVSGTSPCAPVTSATRTLTVSSVSISAQPQPQTICSNTNATFSVTATGATAYQWQYSTDGTNWFDITGEVTASYTTSGATSSNSGQLFRCLLNGGAGSGGINSDGALLTVYDVVAIGTQPTNQSVCEASPVTFTAAATGSGLTYKWQFSTNGGTSWTDVASGGTSTSYTISSPTGAMSGNQYHVIVSGTSPCSAVTSSAATLNVISVSVAASPSSVCLGSATTLTATYTGSPASASSSWQCAVAGSGATTAVTTNPALITPTATGSYTYTYTTTGTCSFTKTVAVTVNALPVITTATATPARVCSGATINLAATSTASTTTTFSIGQPSDTAANLSSLSGYGMYFAATVASTINSVDIYPSTAGTLVVTLKNTIGTVLDTRSFTIAAGDISTTVKKTLALGFSIPAGATGYTINYDIAINRGGGSYTYPSTSNGFSITGNTINGNNISSGTRYYFYNWNVTNTTVIDNASLYTWSWNSSPAVTAVSGTTSVTNTSGTVASTTFTATATSASGCSTSLAASAVSVNSAIATPTGTDSTQCGTGTPTCSVTGTGISGNTFHWYLLSSGGTALAGQTGTTLSSYSIGSTTPFYVSEVSADGLCEGPRVTVTANVTNPFAFTLSASTATNCSGSPSLSPVTIATNGGYTSYSWTNSATVSGNQTTGWYFSPTTTTTYTLTATGGGCSTTATVIVTPTALPVVTATPVPAAVCVGSSSTLTALTTVTSSGTATFGAGASTTTVSGTSSGNSVSPFSHYFGGYKAQYIIKASELTALGYTAGSLTSLAFDVTTAGTTYNSFTLSMGTTSATATTSTYNTAALTQVYTSNLNVAATGLLTLSFGTGAGSASSFSWDGTSNLLINLCWSNVNGGGTAAEVKYDSTTFASMAYSRADSVSAATICGATTATTQTNRPKMVFNGQLSSQGAGTLAYTWNDPSATTGNVLTVSPTATTPYTVSGYNSTTGCTGSATTTVTVYTPPTAPSAISAPQCGSRIPLVSVADTNGYTTPIFKWYADNTTTTALQTSTSTTYTTSVSVTTTFYVSVVSPGGCESGRTAVTTTIVSPATLTVSPAVTICAGASTTLTVSGAVSYTWTPALGLNGTTSASVIATPAASTTYSVTGVDSNGCTTAAATVAVTVAPYPSALSITRGATSVCVDSVMSLTATGGTVGSTGSGKIGSGTAANTGSTPYKGFYGGQRTQQLYTASELTALGLVANSSISSLGFVSLSGTPLLLNGFTVKAGFVSATTLGSAFISGATTTVFAGTTYTPSTGTGNLDYALSSSIVWDGTSSLLIETCFNNNNTGGTSANSLSIESSTVASGLNLYNSQDSTADVCTNATTPSSSTNRPNVRISYSNVTPTTITWSPTTDLYTTAGAGTGYTGGNASVVYTKPQGTITYTATASNGSCSVQATTTVTPNPKPVFSLTNVTICNGQSTTLTATGAGNTYAWSPPTGLSATTGSSVTANPTATTTYTVVATDSTTGCQDTKTVVVTVSQPGAILTTGTTTTQTVVPGQSTTFTVAVASGATYSYQWQVNSGSGWSNLSNTSYYTGTATATLTLTNIDFSLDNYQYQCLVTGASPCATLTPIVATLSVSTTGFAQQPQDVTVCAPSSTSFSIVTSGDAPYGIQWQMSTDNGATYADLADGLDVTTGLTFSGFDTLTLNVSGITPSNNGTKFRNVLNFFLPSNPATLTVKTPVAITTPPVDKTVCASGGTATFAVTATGSSLTYLWQFSTNGGTSWASYTGTGATTASISILNPAVAAEGTQYRVVVSGDAACASATSATATLHINNPTITAQPVAATVLRGNTATFAVTASAATSYEWQGSTTLGGTYTTVADGTPTGNTYTGATSATLSVITSATTALGSANFYRCVVTNNGCTVTSTGAQLTVVYYCTPAPTSVDGTGITNVTMGDINNTTVAETGNYGDYSAQSTTATQLSTVNFAITYETGYTYGTKIWIDFNDNGVFTDAGEQVYYGLSSSANPTTLSGSFNLALTAPLGSHRMRIGGSDNDAGVDPCYASSFAAFEDYTINIIPAPACSGTPTAGTAAAASASLCTGGSTTVTLTGSTTGVTGISYQWNYSTNGTSFSPVSGATTASLSTGTLTAAAYYNCTVTCATSGLSATSNTVAITVSDPQITGSTPAGRCGTGTVALAATANAGSSVNWYSASTNGTLLGTGASFTTPSISATTTYYAEAFTGDGSGTAATAYSGTTNNGTSTGSHGIAITTTIPNVKITSVDIPFTGTGTLTIALKDTSNSTIYSSVTTSSVTGSGTTAVTVPLNLTIPTAGNYLLIVNGISGSVGALGTSTVTYPVTALSGKFSVTGGYWYGVGTTNMYLYNLKVSAGCSSARTAVIASVDALPTATISYAGSPYCNNLTSGGVTLNGTNAYTGGTFTSTTGLTLDASTGNVNPSTSTPGSYLVTYTTNATTYCTPQTATATVVIYDSVLTSGFSYASTSYCTNSGTVTPTFTGATGTFTVVPPTGLSISSTTGAINFATSTPGNYKVTNTVTACSNNSATDFNITVYSIAAITSQPVSTTVCSGSNASMTVVGSGTGTVVYQWQVSTNGTTWNNVADDSTYSGSNTATLSFTAVTTSLSGYQYRVSVSDSNPCSGAISSVATLTVSQPAAPIITPAAINICTGGIQALTVTNPLSGNGTFGTGTSSTSTISYPNPLSAYYGGVKHQMMFTSTELLAQGLSAGSVITSVKFDLSAFAANACTNFTIRMGTTSNTALTAFVTGTTDVYGPTTFTPSATGLVTFALATPFTWNGTSNLVIETVHNAGNGGNGSGTTTKYTTTATNTVFYGAKDNVTGGIAGYDALTSWSSTGASANRPNMILTFSTGTTTWTPIGGLYTNTGGTTAYTIGASVATVYAKPTGTSTYTVTNTNGGGCTNSSTVTVTVLTPSTLSSIVQPVTTCSGAQTTFNLTGLLPSSTSTIAYTVNSVAATPLTGVVADASGNGSFTLALAAFTNGQTLAITSITRTDLTPSCTTAITANNTVVISVQPLVTYYADTDGDGYGNLASPQITCQGQPLGYVLDSTDCDDTDATKHTSFSFYADTDGDGYGAGTSISLCAVNSTTPPTGYSVNNTDCAPSDPTKHASFSFYADTDGDGYGAGSLVSVCAVDASTPPAGYSLNNTDCAPSDAAVHATFDFYVDTDGDGYGAGSVVSLCAVDGATPPTGYSVNNTDCAPNDPTMHASFSFYADTDGDGYGAGSLVSVCAVDRATPPAGYSLNNTDCAPSNPAMHASFPFYADNDGDGYGAGPVVSVCAVNGLTPPTGYSLTNDDCDDTNPLLNPTNPCPTSSVVNLKLFVQGYYVAGGSMVSVANNQDSGISPMTDVEELIVELHDSTVPSTVVARSKGMLHTDGTISCSYSSSPSGSFYVVVKPMDTAIYPTALRTGNFLETWSTNPITVGATVATYDFSTSGGQAYTDGSSTPMKEVELGVFALFTGDLNLDGVIDGTDATNLFNDVENSAFGILATDLNGDGSVDNTDIPFYQNNSDNSVYSQHP